MAWKPFVGVIQQMGASSSVLAQPSCQAARPIESVQRTATAADGVKTKLET